ncbi:MAG: hypothetical protein IT496_01645 [Gammaproteobacteria bacterium]|nr:hypothetical protein [Gammaproteobacteria bacterium]
MAKPNSITAVRSSMEYHAVEAALNELRDELYQLRAIAECLSDGVHDDVDGDRAGDSEQAARLMGLAAAVRDGTRRAVDIVENRVDLVEWSRLLNRPAA